jgi:hypothetical protein
MLLQSTFSRPQASGFVAFDGGGATDIEAPPRARAPAEPALAPRLEPELVRSADASTRSAAEWHGSPTWQPSTGALVRRVEGAVIVAVCGYFAFGLASVAGWL